MDKRETLVAAALKVLEQDGAEKFSTRAVCSIANVTAPTLYHHFGSADGLLSAALEEAHRQYLERKKAIRSSDPVLALEEGWNDFVRFAAERPRLYAAMMARLMQGGDIPAFGQGYALLVERIEAIAAAGRLAMAVEDAAQTAWASSNAAAILHVAAALQVTAALKQPDPAVIDGLRDYAMKAICKSRSK